MDREILCCIDEDTPCGLSRRKQFVAICCMWFLSLLGLITFIVIISARHNLAPDDQVLQYTTRDRSGIKEFHGPGDFQMHPFQRKDWRKALKLNATEWVQLRNVMTNVYFEKQGPLFEFMDPLVDFARRGTTMRLKVDEYVRMIDTRTGVEEIVRGPTTFAPIWINRLLVVEKATVLTKDIAIVTRNRTTADIQIVTTCDHAPGPFFPTPTMEIIETRRKIHVAPYEALVLRDSNGGTQTIHGSSPPLEMSGLCGVAAATDGVSAGGFAFFLPAFSRILRMKWSDYSTPPTKAANMSTTTIVTDTSSRRRRTTKSRVVLGQSFEVLPTNWLVAGDFDKPTNTWLNRGTGVALTNVVQSGSVTVSTQGSNRPTALLEAVVGHTDARLEFGNIVYNGFTICSITRYLGGSKRTVLGGPGFAQGHWRGFAGVVRMGNQNHTQMLYDAVRPDTEWVPMCSTSSKSPPSDVWLYEEPVGVNQPAGVKVSQTVSPGRLWVNGDEEKSDFAVAEIIVWDRALSDGQIRDVMAYFRARMYDAATYADQDVAELVTTEIPRKEVVNIDLRTQKSFYKYQVRTNDNVRLVIDGTIFWEIADVAAMMTTTSDPDGDVWSKSRSILVGAISSVPFNEFLSSFNEIVASAFDDYRNNTFWSERGLNFVSAELTSFDPIDTTTINSLRSILQKKVDRIVRLTKQRSDNDVRRIRLAAEIALEDNKTTLIRAKAINSKLEAQTIGATAGGRKARSIAAFLDATRRHFPDSPEQQVSLYEHYLTLKLAERQAQKLFNGRARVFLTPQGTNISLLAPGTTFGSPTPAPSGRLLSGPAPPAAGGRSRSLFGEPSFPLLPPPPPPCLDADAAASAEEGSWDEPHGEL